MRRKAWVLGFVVVYAFSMTTYAQPVELDRFSNQVIQSFLQNETPQTSTVERKEKSHSTALLLGWSPIPGDGLYYTGHPVQGTFALGLGTVGALMAFTGKCTGGVENECAPIGYLFGGLLFGSAYLWDALKTASYAKEYKRED